MLKTTTSILYIALLGVMLFSSCSKSDGFTSPIIIVSEEEGQTRSGFFDYLAAHSEDTLTLAKIESESNSIDHFGLLNICDSKTDTIRIDLNSMFCTYGLGFEIESTKNQNIPTKTRFKIQYVPSTAKLNFQTENTCRNDIHCEITEDDQYFGFEITAQTIPHNTIMYFEK